MLLAPFSATFKLFAIKQTKRIQRNTLNSFKYYFQHEVQLVKMSSDPKQRLEL